MEVSEKFQITLKISGQNFPITIKVKFLNYFV